MIAAVSRGRKHRHGQTYELNKKVSVYGTKKCGTNSYALYLYPSKAVNLSWAVLSLYVGSGSLFPFLFYRKREGELAL